MTLGVVVIGRNEGQRLIKCLESIKARPLVYVDSGSTDESLKNASSLGAETVELDLSIPFTAARARNAGFERLRSIDPKIEYVFFVDGDCVVDEHWLAKASEHLDSHPQVAVVCGQRKEIDPDASLYNGFCDIEWNTPAGKATACGGDAVFRAAVLQQLGGYDPSFIAGEEPELCFRIRQLEFEIERIDAVMTYHDAAIYRFSQWWKRTERSGHAYYLGWHKHGQVNQEQFYRQDLRSILIWVGILCLGAALSVLSLSIWPIVGAIALWAVQTLRIYRRLDERYQHHRASLRLAYSFSLMLGKIPQALGICKAYITKSKGRQATLVEYK